MRVSNGCLILLPVLTTMLLLFCTSSLSWPDGAACQASVYAQENRQQQQQVPQSQPSSSFCGTLKEDNFKESVKDFLYERVHPTDKSKVWSFSAPLLTNFYRGTSCTINDIDSTKSFPVYSLQHVGLAPSPSPFYAESYRNQEQNLKNNENTNNNNKIGATGSYQQSAFRAADRFLTWIEDRVPLIGFVVKGLRLPIVIAFTHGGSFVSAVQIAVANRASPQSLSAISEQIAPQTSHLLKFVNYLDDAIRYALFRQVVDVFVSEIATTKEVTLAEGTVDVFAVALPAQGDGAKQCSGIKSAYEVKTLQGTSRSVNCRAPSSLAMFHGPTEFVNSVFAWVPALFYKYVVMAGDPRFRQAGRPAPTCTVDTTLNSAEAAPQCVFVICKNREKCSLQPLTVQFEQRLEFDVAVFFLLASAVLTGFLRPYASRSAAVRWVLCTLAGVVVLVILLCLFFYRLVEGNTTMKFGFVAAAGITGLYAASTGIITYLVSALFELVFSNVIAAAAFAGLCVISVFMAHRFFGSSMPLVIDLTMSLGSWFFFFAAMCRNIELVAVIYINYFILKHVIFYGILKFILVSIFGSAVSGLFSGESSDSIPRDSFPAHVYKLVEHEVPSKALANKIGWGETPEARNKKFVQQGNSYTQRQLDLLYKELRKNPTKYANRLQNPNAVFRQAGVGEEEE